MSIETSISTYSLGVKKLEIKLEYEFDENGKILGPYIYAAYSGFGELGASKLRGTYQVNTTAMIGEFIFNKNETRVQPIEDVYNEGNFRENYRVDLDDKSILFFKELKLGKSIEYVLLGGRETSV